MNKVATSPSYQYVLFRNPLLSGDPVALKLKAQEHEGLSVGDAI